MFRVKVVNLIKTVYENFGTGVVTGSLAYRYYVSHVEETPITGRKRFLIFSRKKAEKASQENFEKRMEKYAGSIVPPEHPQSQRVIRLGKKLLDANKDIPEIHTKNWTFTVLNDSKKSAFSLFNGHIFVSTTEEKFATSDDELAITLGHEIAHSLLGHARERSSNYRLLGSAGVLTILIVWAMFPFSLLAIITYILGLLYIGKPMEFVFNYLYSRKQESEADKVGLQLVAKACFDVRDAVAHYHKHAFVDELHGGLNRSREWRSSHPSHATRQKELEKQLPSAIRIREECDCPELPFIDPRYVLRLAIEKMVAERKQK